MRWLPWSPVYLSMHGGMEDKLLYRWLIGCYSDSNTFLVMEEVYRAPIPFEEQWGQIKLMKTLWYFLEHLVGMVASEAAKFQDIITKLVSKR